MRVDAAGSHAVAGIVLSGVKFHGRVDEATFTREVSALVVRTFAAANVEEVDVWVTVPVPVDKDARVSGDMAMPTTRIVYGLTVRRAEADTFDRGMTARNSYWDPHWRATLVRQGVRGSQAQIRR